MIKKRLFALADALRASHPAAALRCCVDTAPLLEREHAAAAGLGWVGRHTLLIHPRHGSFLLLGAIVTDLDLAPSDRLGHPGPLVPPTDRCGTCTRCIDACPTGCIFDPRLGDYPGPPDLGPPDPAPPDLGPPPDPPGDPPGPRPPGPRPPGPRPPGSRPRGTRPPGSPTLDIRFPRRRFRGAPGCRRLALHQLSDHRAPLLDRSRAARGDGRLADRLRRLPGGVPLQRAVAPGRGGPPIAPDPFALPAAGRAGRRAGSVRRASVDRGGSPGGVPRVGAQAGEARHAPPQRGDRAGEPGRGGGAPTLRSAPRRSRRCGKRRRGGAAASRRGRRRRTRCVGSGRSAACPTLRRRRARRVTCAPRRP